MEGNQNLTRINIKTFTSKFQTKNELWALMTQEVKAFCPPKDTVTAWHLRDMATGAKGILKCDQLKHLSVPQYKEVLSIEKILAWAKANHPEVVQRFFPSVEREISKLPR